MKKKRVVFVCMGNICRSPAGEAVLRKLVAQRGLEDQVEVDSAGTLGYHAGNLPDERMREAARARGYNLESRARQFVPEDFERFDLIVAMDRDNLHNIRALDRDNRHERKARLLGDFLPDGRARDVPDPYYGGPDGFETVLDMIEAAAEPILHHLLDKGAYVEAGDDSPDSDD